MKGNTDGGGCRDCDAGGRPLLFRDLQENASAGLGKAGNGRFRECSGKGFEVLGRVALIVFTCFHHFSPVYWHKCG